MPDDTVVVLGFGTMTAVGLTAAETAASVGAGLMRFTETEIHDRTFEPFTLAEVPEDALPPLETASSNVRGIAARERRMLRLATTPLREATRALADSTDRSSQPLFLALPEIETARPLDRLRFLNRLAIQVPGTFDPQRSDASHTGRAGGLVALGHAMSAIQSGWCELAIAGGVDTYRDLYVLGALDAAGRVKSPRNMDGMIPGEAAAFLLLGSDRAARARGVKPLARLSSLAVGLEPGHLYSEEPYKGEGLAVTFQGLMAAGAIEEPLSHVYSSMNGESHWAKEWGVGQIRAKAAFRPGYRMHHPADSFGDTGAACGPLMAGLAATAIGTTAAPTSALVYASSDRGQRAALVVHPLSH